MIIEKFVKDLEDATAPFERPDMGYLRKAHDERTVAVDTIHQINGQHIKIPQLCRHYPHMAMNVYQLFRSSRFQTKLNKTKYFGQSLEIQIWIEVKLGSQVEQISCQDNNKEKIIRNWSNIPRRLLNGIDIIPFTTVTGDKIQLVKIGNCNALQFKLYIYKNIHTYINITCINYID